MAEEWDSTRFVYSQMADRIAAQIAAGELAAGDRLPSESELSEEFGVARMTVRRAIEELRTRGLVVTLRGRGTFVARPGAGED